MHNQSSRADEATGRLKTITEMAALYQVSLRTLRFYENRGMIKPTRVGMQRLYAGKDETRLQIILRGKRLGFTLSEIEDLILSSIDRNPHGTTIAPDDVAAAALTPSFVKEKIEKLEQLRASTDAAIAELTAEMETRTPARV